MNLKSFKTKWLMQGFNHFKTFCFLIPLIFSNYIFAVNEIKYYDDNNKSILPDTIPIEGDTINVFVSGADSIFVLYEDTSINMEEAWDIGFPTSNMLIELTHHHLPFNEGVNGINITDFFEVGHAQFDDNGNYTNVPDPWQALAEAAPKTLRIFSGAGSKFMHPLGYFDPTSMLINGGYGYDINEIIPFYDITALGSPPSVGELYDDIITEPDGFCGDCNEWMADEFVQDFSDFFVKWNKQQVDVPPYAPGAALESQSLYINEFINLIQYIEGANPGHRVDVIVCLNILSSTATECKELVNYLRTNTTYPINVVGVEMGNEVYFKFQQESLGFSSFENYWDYIHGETYPGLSEVLPPAVLADHDFITALKGDPLFPDIKIGLPAENLPNCGEGYDFPLGPPSDDDEIEVLGLPGDCPCDFPDSYPDWNEAMVPYYGETIIAGTETRYEFDAIIFHTYYTPTNNTALCPVNSNWRDLLLMMHPYYNPLDPMIQIFHHINSQAQVGIM